MVKINLEGNKVEIHLMDNKKTVRCKRWSAIVNAPKIKEKHSLGKLIVSKR